MRHIISLRSIVTTRGAFALFSSRARIPNILLKKQACSSFVLQKALAVRFIVF